MDDYHGNTIIYDSRNNKNNKNNNNTMKNDINVDKKLTMVPIYGWKDKSFILNYPQLYENEVNKERNLKQPGNVNKQQKGDRMIEHSRRKPRASTKNQKKKTESKVIKFTSQTALDALDLTKRDVNAIAIDQQGFLRSPSFSNETPDLVSLLKDTRKHSACHKHQIKSKNDSIIDEKNVVDDQSRKITQNEPSSLKDIDTATLGTHHKIKRSKSINKKLFKKRTKSSKKINDTNMTISNDDKSKKYQSNIREDETIMELLNGYSSKTSGTTSITGVDMESSNDKKGVVLNTFSGNFASDSSAFNNTMNKKRHGLMTGLKKYFKEIKANAKKNGKKQSGSQIISQSKPMTYEEQKHAPLYELECKNSNSSDDDLSNKLVNDVTDKKNNDDTYNPITIRTQQTTNGDKNNPNGKATFNPSNILMSKHFSSTPSLLYSNDDSDCCDDTSTKYYDCLNRSMVLVKSSNSQGIPLVNNSNSNIIPINNNLESMSRHCSVTTHLINPDLNISNNHHTFANCQSIFCPKHRKILPYSAIKKQYPKIMGQFENKLDCFIRNLEKYLSNSDPVLTLWSKQLLDLAIACKNYIKNDELNAKFMSNIIYQVEKMIYDTCESDGTKFEIFKPLLKHFNEILSPPALLLDCLHHSFIDLPRKMEYFKQNDPRLLNNFLKYISSNVKYPFSILDEETTKLIENKSKNDDLNTQNDDVNGATKTNSKSKIVKLSDFKIVRKISKGKFGEISLVQYKNSGLYFAMKTIPRERYILKNQISKLYNERDIHIYLNSHFIAKLFCTLSTRENVYYVMEYVSGGDLAYYVDNGCVFKHTVIKNFMAQLVMALEFLHSKEIVHRDLKPNNILVTGKFTLKLADFGLSDIALKYELCDMRLDGRYHRIVGTPYYMAPEVILNLSFGKSVDWWALGIIMYELYFHDVPFCGQTLEEIFESITHTPLIFTGCPLDAQSIDLLSKLLIKNPRKRSEFIDMELIFKHEYFQEISFEKVLDTMKESSSSMERISRKRISQVTDKIDSKKRESWLSANSQRLSVKDVSDPLNDFDYTTEIFREMISTDKSKD